MIIGITGGIGAGKSTVMEYIRDNYDVYTILSDDVARKLQLPGGKVYQELTCWLGDEILVNPGGEIDRAKLATIVFADEEKLHRLNEITHPAVREEIIAEIDRERKLHKHVAVEAALLIEEHYDEICDELWYIDVPDEIRVERLIASRGYSLEKCRQIMDKQLSRDEFKKSCDQTIVNDGDLDKLKSQLDSALNV